MKKIFKIIEKYLNEDILDTQKELKQDVISYFNTKNIKISEKSKGKYIEQKIKCKNNKNALDIIDDFKTNYISKGFTLQNAPLISPSKEYRFYNKNIVLVMFIDYTNVNVHNSSVFYIYYPKSNK